MWPRKEPNLPDEIARIREHLRRLEAREGILDIIQRAQVILTLTNRSGGAVNEGDVVIVDVANDESFTTTVNVGSILVLGVVQEDIANLAVGRVLVEGYAPVVEVNDATARGDFLRTSGVATRATSQATMETGIFAKALTSTVGAGQVSAELFGVDSGAGGAYPPGWKFDLDEPKAVADDPDDEFDTGALDVKWTVVDGAANPVDLMADPTGRYDLTTRVGFLLLQARNTDNVDLRQDYTLPDTQSIVLAFSFGMAIDARSGILTDEVIVGLSLNNNDGGAHLGNYIVVEADADPDGWKIRSYFTGIGDYDSTPENQHGAPLARRIYFRIIRDGTSYWSYYSGDGTTWQSLGAAKAVGAILDNIWIYVHTVGALSPTPIHAVDWIREGDDAFDPW